MPIRQWAQRVAFNRLPEVELFAEEWLESGVIRHSKSPWASPLVLVKKEDGSTWLCVDFRWLNDVTVGDSFPVPRIDDSLRALGGAQIFSTQDLTKGYWQVPVNEEDKEKTAFTCHKGLFEFVQYNALQIEGGTGHVPEADDGGSQWFELGGSSRIPWWRQSTHEVLRSTLNI